jgi:S-DNA-T family DNA segregation ATPase FtsK/SpoIIIE
MVLNLIRLARAFGVILVQATQRPDSDSLPKGISSNAGIRIALRLMDDAANNMVLGAGMYGAGIRATDFTSKDKGVAWLVGVEDEPFVAKSYNITSGMAERIGQRARKLREQAGRLTGMAAGLAPAEPAPRFDLLADVRRVMAELGADWIWSQTAAERLAELRPEVVPRVDRGRVRAGDERARGAHEAAQQARPGRRPAEPLGRRARPDRGRGAIFAVAAAATTRSGCASA